MNSNKLSLLALLFCYGISAESITDAFKDGDIQAKSEEAKSLVDDAVDLIKKQGIAVACKAFMSDPSWVHGELYVFVFDTQGYCYCHGYQKDCIWKKFPEGKEDDFVKQMGAVGKVGGFTDYNWNNAYSRAYVKNVTIGKKTYIVGAGLYPVSAIYFTQELVDSAATYLKTHSFAELKERINNTSGIFVRGDLHLEMYDYAGICVANGEMAALVGQNLIDAKSADDKFLIRDMIEIAKTKGEGWYDCISIIGNEPTRIYVKKIVDPETKIPYIVTCNYYTKITSETVVDLVKRAADYLRANGRERAFRDFNIQEKFAKGNVNVFVYNTNGDSLADSKNPAFVGHNLINTRDSQGRPVVKQIIEMATTYGKGWVTNALSNTYQVAYSELVKVSDGDFVIGAAYFPVSKESFVRFMIDDALLYLQNHSLEESLFKFTNKSFDFLRGDLSIFVYNMNGICLVDGLNVDKIWSNDKTAKDDKGIRVIDKITAIAKTGGGWLTFDLNNAVCHIYVKMIDKADKDSKPEQYIVGSGYYE